MEKISDRVKKRVVIHELGHLFTLILFAKSEINVREIKSVNFYLDDMRFEGMVESKGEIDAIDFYSTEEEVANILRLVLPSIINSIAGYALETLFDSSQTFESRFERCGPKGMNQDYQNVNNLRTYTAKYIEDETTINADNCIAISKRYMEFLNANFKEELKNIADYILNAKLSDVINSDGTILIFQDQMLTKLLERIESVIKPECITTTIEWYNKLAEKHKVMLKRQRG